LCVIHKNKYQQADEKKSLETLPEINLNNFSELHNDEKNTTTIFGLMIFVLEQQQPRQKNEIAVIVLCIVESCVIILC
jgi:hypothetical protein